ncbi:MAG: histidine kinase, partial [Neobacillus sp.]|nr:histidine kinase [Neobacillus sp.]
MLILILIFLAMVSITLVIFKRDGNSMLLLGLCGSLILMFSGIIIYTAKIGGLKGSQEIFLFMSPKIKNWLQYMLITLDKIGYLIAIGRYLFPTFLLLIAVNYSMIPFIIRHRKRLIVLLIPPTISLILYYPQVFYIAVRNRFALQVILMTSMLAWIFLYLALAIGLLLNEYISITMVYFSRQFRFILFFLVSLALLYVIYSVQDPIQVYQLYGTEFLW